jgi:hypothetical protein
MAVGADREDGELLLQRGRPTGRACRGFVPSDEDFEALRAGVAAVFVQRHGRPPEGQNYHIPVAGAVLSR